MKSKKKTGLFWDKIAKKYDRIESKDKQINDKIIEKTKQRLNKNHSVLDFGCGTATAAIEIAEDVNRIMAIDFSAGMIEIAKTKCAKLSIRNIDFLQTTVFDESLKPGSFDVILCFYLIHLLEDAENILKRVYSLLKPGGLMISATPCMKGTVYGFLLPLLGKTGIIPHVRIFSMAELKCLISGGNFEIIEDECIEKKGNQYYIAARKNVIIR